MLLVNISKYLDINDLDFDHPEISRIRFERIQDIIQKDLSYVCTYKTLIIESDKISDFMHFHKNFQTNIHSKVAILYPRALINRFGEEPSSGFKNRVKQPLSRLDF